MIHRCAGGASSGGICLACGWVTPQILEEERGRVHARMVNLDARMEVDSAPGLVAAQAACFAELEELKKPWPKIHWSQRYNKRRY